MRFIKSYLRAIVLPALSLGLLVPVTGAAAAQTINGTSSGLAGTQQLEYIDSFSKKASIEKSILHRSTPIEIVLPRHIYTELGFEDISGDTLVMKTHTDSLVSSDRQ